MTGLHSAGLQVQLRSTRPIRLAAQFDCAAGELVALVGPSGSGKTSLLRAIAGLWTPGDVQGHIRVAGQAWLDTAAGVQLKAQQRRAGLVFQHYALFPHMTAHANVALAAGPGWTVADVQALLKRLGLDALSQRRPAQLSGGQQQRVALARALVRVMPTPQWALGATSAGSACLGAEVPSVLLLDEPFSAVDAPTRQALYRELAALRQQVAVPMVLVTHDLHEARRLADRVVILDDGESLQTGPPERVFASPRNARVAQLVGIQNHYQGHFHKAEPGWGRLVWQGQQGMVQLSAVDKNRLDDNTPVTWVLNGEHVDVLPDGAPLTAPGQAASGPVNRLRCQLIEMLALGDTSLCTLVPEGLAEQRITLNLAGRLLLAWGLASGDWVRLEFPPQALHIMPLRDA